MLSDDLVEALTDSREMKAWKLDPTDLLSFIAPESAALRAAETRAFFAWGQDQSIA